MIKGAIFDVDGTLLDSMGIWHNAGSDYVKSLGIVPTAEIDEKFMTMPICKTAEYIKAHYNLPKSAEQIMEEVNGLVEDGYYNRVQAKEDIGVFLKKLADKGVEMCVATATDEYLVDAALKRCNIRQYFKKIFTCSMVKKGKNKPDIYRMALDYIKTPKENTVVFEDIVLALNTAKNDGFLTVGVYDKYEKDQDGVKSTAHLYMDKYSDFDAFWKHFND